MPFVHLVYQFLFNGCFELKGRSVVLVFDLRFVRTVLLFENHTLCHAVKTIPIIIMSEFTFTVANEKQTNKKPNG